MRQQDNLIIIANSIIMVTNCFGVIRGVIRHIISRKLFVFIVSPSTLNYLQISFPLINVFANCCFLFLFIEEEWNPDGKGRQSNDTGEY